MDEPVYRVVWPLGKLTVQSVSLKPRIASLAGKTICELSHGGFRDQEIRPILEETLAKQYPGVKFVDHSVFGYIHGVHGPKALAALPEKLREQG